MKILATIITLLFSTTILFSQNADSLVFKHGRDMQIYTYTTSIYKHKFWVQLYKIDWNVKTIQFAQIEFKEGDKITDIESINQVFRKAVPPSKFIILGSNKIKVERIRRKRSWLNFATPSVKSSSAERYFINGDTLTFGKGKKAAEYFFDKELTLRYEQEKRKQ